MPVETPMMDFLQGKRLGAPSDDTTGPPPPTAQATTPTKGSGPTSPAQHAFKKRRKVHDRFFLSPLSGDAMTLSSSRSSSLLSTVAASPISMPSSPPSSPTSQSAAAHGDGSSFNQTALVDELHVPDCHHRWQPPPSTASPTATSPHRQSPSKQSSIRRGKDALVPKARHVARLVSTTQGDALPQTPTTRGANDDSATSDQGQRSLDQLEKSLSIAFWNRHFPAVSNTAGFALDDDIRAYCQRGPVASIAQHVGKCWLANLLRAYDLPHADCMDGYGDAERQLQLLVRQAKAHVFHDGGDERAFEAAVMAAVAQDILDTCTSDWSHTVAGYYRELLTNLPALLKERDARLQVAAAAIARLEDNVRAERHTNGELIQAREALQAQCAAAAAQSQAHERKADDLAAVLQDTIATELAATTHVRTLQVEVRELEHLLHLKSQQCDQQTIEVDDMWARCRGLEATVDTHTALCLEATRDRDAADMRVKDLSAQVTALTHDNAVLTNKITDLNVEQQVLLLRMGAVEHEGDKAMRRVPSTLKMDSQASSAAAADIAALEKQIESLQDQVFRQSVHAAAREKQRLVEQNENVLKEELLKRLDAALVATKAEKEAAEAANSFVAAQRETLRQRIGTLQASGAMEMEAMRTQLEVLGRDKLRLLEEIKQAYLDRDVALDDLHRRRMLAEKSRVMLRRIVRGADEMQRSKMELRNAVAYQFHAFAEHMGDVKKSIRGAVGHLVTKEHLLLHDIHTMQKKAIKGDPVFQYTLRGFQKQLVGIKHVWDQLKRDAAAHLADAAKLHLEYVASGRLFVRVIFRWRCSRKMGDIRVIAARIHDKWLASQKPKPKKQPLISIPSTKSIGKGHHQAGKPAVVVMNATTQTDTNHPTTSTAALSDQLTHILLPALEATEAKLVAVMAKVDGLKMELLAAYEREAALKNRLDATADVPHVVDTTSAVTHDARHSTPPMIVAVRDQLLQLTTPAYVQLVVVGSLTRSFVRRDDGLTTNLVLHVADLYNMLHTNLDALEASLDDGPVLYIERRDSCGNLVALPLERHRPSPSTLSTQGTMFQPSKTSSKTLFPAATSSTVVRGDGRDIDSINEAQDNRSSATTSSMAVAQLGLSVGADGELLNLPPCVRKRVKTAVLKLAAAALFQDLVTVADVTSLFLTSDPDVDVSAHLLGDITDDQHVQNLSPAFSHERNGDEDTFNGDSHRSPSGRHLRHGQNGGASSGQPNHPPKDVTRLLALVGADVFSDEKAAGDIAPHPKAWLIKQIRSLYHDKFIAESLEHAALHVTLAFPEFVVQWAFLKFGVKELVAKTCHAILDGANAWKTSTPEVALFAAFLAETGPLGYGKSDLSLFLHARHLIVNIVGDMRDLSEDDVPRLTSTQAVAVVDQVFHTMVHHHRRDVMAKLHALLRPMPTEAIEVMGDEAVAAPPTPHAASCFDFDGLPPSEATTAGYGAFPESKVKKAPPPTHVTDPRLLVGQDATPPTTPEIQWIDVHQLLRFCVLEFRDERRRFFIDMQAYAGSRKLRDDISKPVFEEMLVVSFDWTPTIAELIFEEASGHSGKKTVETDGSVLVDRQHLMCVALQYYTNLFALARFTDGLSVDQTEDLSRTGGDGGFIAGAAPRYRHRDTTRVCV
ncbi:Aste57867_14508 [Aphanomyces stellatus]|uniref:Aste57867_14508 protein n=1 Tax=Aphanomyces stellatus TaxID=120398 RepID=A0A485L3B1_9STRA|nr:hypothetical protein As57867_014454 [Aphanomyces stellatus]VFT91330.1 Aste57867_14508 [Aphanomyces stellatus]